MAIESSTSPPKSLDRLYWLVVFALVGGGVFLNWYYQDYSLLLRVAGLIVLAAVAGFVFLQTERGKATWVLLLGARSEVRRVVWPTRQVTIQSTVIVLLMVFVVALLLWALDSLLSWGIQSVLG